MGHGSGGHGTDPGGMRQRPPPRSEQVVGGDRLGVADSGSKGSHEIYSLDLLGRVYLLVEEVVEQNKLLL